MKLQGNEVADCTLAQAEAHYQVTYKQVIAAYTPGINMEIWSARLNVPVGVPAMIMLLQQRETVN